MVLALLMNALLYSAVLTNPQSREPQLATCLQKAMSEDAQAALSKLWLACVMVLRYANS